jgi:outer membrane biosynthesis protein TonB
MADHLLLWGGDEMRILLGCFLLLASSAVVFADEAIEAYAKRVQAHIDQVRHNPTIWQAAQRQDAREVHVNFTVFPNGEIGDVKIGRSSFSRELNALIARCFSGLPPVNAVPKKFAPQRFSVVLSLGSKLEQQ